MEGNEKQIKTVKERQARDKEKILEQLRKMPVVQVTCEKAGIARATYYRWRNEDEGFRKAAEEASAEGEAFITDMSETQLISMIRDKNFQAVQLWLRHHHPKYSNKLEVLGSVKVEDERLTAEQEEVIRQAFQLAENFDKPEETESNRQTSS